MQFASIEWSGKIISHLVADLVYLELICKLFYSYIGVGLKCVLPILTLIFSWCYFLEDVCNTFPLGKLET